MKDILLDLLEKDLIANSKIKNSLENLKKLNLKKKKPKTEALIDNLIEDIIETTKKLLKKEHKNEKKTGDLNKFLYILSAAGEENPEQYNEKTMAIVREFLPNKEFELKDEEELTKVNINALTIYGYYILKMMKEKKGNLEDELFAQISEFIQLLDNENYEIQHNLTYFIEQFLDYSSDEIDNFLLTQTSHFIEYLKKEENSEILKLMERILKRIQSKMSLSFLQSYIKELTIIYQESSVPERSDVIMSLILEEMNYLKDKIKNKKTSKRDVIKLIQNRLPMSRNYNLDEIAKEEEMDKDEVQDALLSSIDQEELFYMTFHKTKLIVLELEPLIDHFSHNRQSIKKILQDLSYTGIEEMDELLILIKGLVGKNYVKGFLTKTYWYPHEYLKNQMVGDLQKTGAIHLKKYNNIIDETYVHNIIRDISEFGNFPGIYNKEKSIFFSFTNITRDIKNELSKTATIDLNKLKSKFEHRDFLRLEENSKPLFTNIHDGHIWLTNLGRTRIELLLKKCEQIGEYSTEEAVKELKISEKIIDYAIRGYFEHKNGFWNQSKTKFIYSKSIQKKINQIQKEKDAGRRDELITTLSKKLDIDAEELSKKVDEKLHNLGKILSTQDEIHIHEQLSNLQMSRKEFLGFIDGFGKQYLIVGDKIIFSEKKIEEEKKGIRKYIESEVAANSIINVQQLFARAKCSQNVLIEIINDLQNEERINGLWIDEFQFLTEQGIKDRMMDTKGFIDLRIFIKDRMLVEKELQYIENILLDLIKTTRIKGDYDAEKRLFLSSENVGISNLEREKDHAINEINTILESLEYKYMSIKEILMNFELKPSEIDQYRDILEKGIGEGIRFESALKRMINIGNSNVKNILKKDGIQVKDEEGNIVSVTRFEEHPEIKIALDDLNMWKDIFFAMDQKADNITYLRKRMRMDPENEDHGSKLNEIFEYLGFF